MGMSLAKIKEDSSKRFNPSKESANFMGMLTRDDIQEIVNNIKEKDNKTKKYKVDKVKVKDFLNTLAYLTKEEREKIINDIDSYVI